MFCSCGLERTQLGGLDTVLCIAVVCTKHVLLSKDTCFIYEPFGALQGKPLLNPAQVCKAKNSALKSGMIFYFALSTRYIDFVAHMQCNPEIFPQCVRDNIVHVNAICYEKLRWSTGREF